MKESLQDKYAGQNVEQTVALEDGFSISRYTQFARHLPEDTRTVLADYLGYAPDRIASLLTAGAVTGP